MPFCFPVYFLTQFVSISHCIFCANFYLNFLCQFSNPVFLCQFSIALFCIIFIQGIICFCFLYHFYSGFLYQLFSDNNFVPIRIFTFCIIFFFIFKMLPNTSIKILQLTNSIEWSEKYSWQGKPYIATSWKEPWEFPALYIKKLLREASYKVEESERKRPALLRAFYFEIVNIRNFFTVISTLLFFARPAAVLLSATEFCFAVTGWIGAWSRNTFAHEITLYSFGPCFQRASYFWYHLLCICKTVDLNL